jgi:hypothetical protein
MEIISTGEAYAEPAANRAAATADKTPLSIRFLLRSATASLGGVLDGLMTFRRRLARVARFGPFRYTVRPRRPLHP